MSDEESFVILGSSPTSSMDTINSLPMAANTAATKTIDANPILNNINANGIADSQLTTSSSSNGSQFSIVHNRDSLKITNGTHEVDGDLLADCVSTFPKELPSNGSCNFASKPSSLASENSIPGKTESIAATSNGMDTSVASNSIRPPVAETSLAASFILGEVNSDVLKASVYSQFPSICSMGAGAEDVMKLQNMMSEYMELKKTLVNTNITMKQLYDQTQKWKADVKAMEEERRTEIAKLRNENLELRRDLENKVEQININEETRRQEHEEFIRSLSDKTAQIENMSTQIMKLEQQQLSSFEFIPKNLLEQTSSNNEPKKTILETVAAEYVTLMEHQRVVKDFERQMSAIVAENLELKDMKQIYIDEIDCLKVNLAASEELHKKTQADINFLKASDEEKTEMFNKYESECQSLRIDLDVLNQQVQIYSRDFKMEQEARENLANEKDQLLSDLRDLQRKNQELIQEAQKQFEEHTKQVMATTGAFPKTRPQSISCTSSPRPSIYKPENIYNCPLCGKIFKTLGVLQTHVNQCLDEGH